MALTFLGGLRIGRSCERCVGHLQVGIRCLIAHKNLSVASKNALSIIFEGVAWNRLREVQVDKEGEHVYSLRPRLNDITHRLLCDVKLVDNVKVVTLRSTVQVQNLTLAPTEMAVFSEKGKQLTPAFKLRASVLLSSSDLIFS